MSFDVNTVIVGAGVIGLAIARALAAQDTDVLILEEKHLFGSETSSRHSEVIHAGIYYPKHSLKAQLCTRGKSLLYDYCDKYAIQHNRIGKIIVATNAEQVDELGAINVRAQNNGVTDLQTLSGAQVSALEPEINAHAGLLSPSTGIVDSHGYMLSLLGNAQSNGAMIAYNTKVEKILQRRPGFEVIVSGADDMQFTCKHLINAAGHGACTLANATQGLAQQHIPEARYAKGNYFRLQTKSPVSRLIYPVPEPGGLGVHITLDQAGQARFGPDVQWQKSLNYDIDTSRSANFYAAIRRYWPALKDNDLVPDYAGVRPKIAFNTQVHEDFVIQGSATHAIDGLINLFGIDSPGITSSLAIAEMVKQLYPLNHR